MDDYSREYLRPARGRASDRLGARRLAWTRGGRRPGRPPGYGVGYRAGYAAEFGEEYRAWDRPESGAWYLREYDIEYTPRYGAERGWPYGAEYREFGARMRPPGKPARGYPVRGIHTYDLDYGDLAGPTTDYSGRAGYAEDRDWVETPRGTYTPRLADIGREARRRRLYGGRGPTYSGPGRRGRGWR